LFLEPITLTVPPQITSHLYLIYDIS